MSDIMALVLEYGINTRDMYTCANKKLVMQCQKKEIEIAAYYYV